MENITEVQASDSASFSYYPAIRDHSYFKASLYRSGFSREIAIKIYNVVMREIRTSILLGYRVDLNPLIDFTPFLKLEGEHYIPHVRATLHQAVQHPEKIFYAKSHDSLIEVDPDWSPEASVDLKTTSAVADGTTEVDYSFLGISDVVENSGNAKKAARIEAQKIVDGVIYHPAVRDHKYFKSALYRAGLTKEQSSRAYNLIMRDIRNSIQDGYQVRLDYLVDFVPYPRRKPSGFLPSVKADIHSSVRSTRTIRYSISVAKTTIFDPDWE
ncbi:hypothetical protein ABGV42_01815 [Paenibacillus pabuli]|uniref:hypothetical protein n=1 Tax=Paenibacillus pabuli TaxID=1472 RepID=UPI0032429628